jgi:hypothetical protein
MPLRGASLESKAQLRERFLGNILSITGDTRVLWTPKPTDTTTSLDESLTGRTLTADATMAAQLSALGNGYARAFNGSTNYLTTPDAADLSFGTGAADLAFSIVVLANVTDTAAIRQILSKNDGASNIEWSLRINAADGLDLFIFDQSASATSCSRASNAAITQGSWHLFAATYSGVGGASAGNGITLYQDAAVIASTATNSGTYVAMENLAAAVEIGSAVVHTLQFFPGSVALIALVAGVLTQSQLWAIKRHANAFFGLSL